MAQTGKSNLRQKILAHLPKVGLHQGKPCSINKIAKEAYCVRTTSKIETFLFISIVLACCCFSFNASDWILTSHPSMIYSLFCYPFFPKQYLKIARKHLINKKIASFKPVIAKNSFVTTLFTSLLIFQYKSGVYRP